MVVHWRVPKLAYVSFLSNFYTNTNSLDIHKVGFYRVILRAEADKTLT